MMHDQIETLRQAIEEGMEGRPVVATAENAGLTRSELHKIRTRGDHLHGAAKIFALLSEIGVDAGQLQGELRQNGA